MTIQQINQIKKQSQGNFIQLITDLKAVGVIKFKTSASTAKSIYYDNQQNIAYDEVEFFNFEIGTVNKQQFISDLKQHQQGVTDFPTWLEQTAGNGIGYWIVDLQELTCTYYDLDDNPIYVEQIPGA